MSNIVVDCYHGQSELSTLNFGFVRQYVNLQEQVDNARCMCTKVMVICVSVTDLLARIQHVEHISWFCAPNIFN